MIPELQQLTLASESTHSENRQPLAFWPAFVLRGHNTSGGLLGHLKNPMAAACATPASFVWRFQAALNAFWDLGRAGGPMSGGFLAGSALGHGSLVDE